MIKSIRETGPGARSRGLLLLTFAAAIGGVLVALIAIRMESTLLSLSLAIGGFGLSMMSLIAGLRWWGAADEAVKEAHKSGWYWGGSLGLGVAAGVMGLLFATPPDVSLRQFALLPGDAGLIATGIALSVLLTLVGYVVGWAAWWLRNR